MADELGLFWPLEPPWRERITQRFGERPEVYRSLGLRGHNGIDFGSPVGVLVRACEAGVVSLVAVDMSGYGLHVKVKHVWGYSLYAHLSEARVQVGEGVRRGSILALTGNSGYSTGPHLHFGIQRHPIRWRDGWRGYCDPLPWMAGRHVV